MKKRRYLPIILIETYLIVSYLMYRFGCYIWPFRSDNRTFFFMIFVIIAFGIGYVLAIKRCTKVDEQKRNKFVTISCEKILIICCLISFVIFVPMCISYTNSWYPPIVKALTDPKGVYYALAEVAKNRTGIRIWGLLDVFPYMVLPLVLYGWEKISVKTKCVAITLSIGYLMIYISSGRNISVAVQMLSVVAAWFSVLFGEKTDFYRKNVIRTSVLALVYCVIVVFFFNLTISSRSGYNKDVALELEQISNENFSMNKTETDTTDVEINGTKNELNLEDNIMEANQEVNEKVIDEFAIIAKDWDAEAMGQHLGVGTYEYNGLEITQEQYEKFKQVYKVFPNYTDIWSKAYVDSDSILMRNLPSGLKNLYVIATGYITNGYNCLTVALYTEHEWTYGIGHSAFLSSYVDAFLGTDSSQKTYYNRLTNDEAYPLVSKSFWPSMFVQLADDLTFPGVIIFMVIAGFVIAKVWMSIINCGNFWGVVLLGQLELWALFLPANNILENSGGFFVTFWVSFLAWVVTQIPARKGIRKSEEANL